MYNFIIPTINHDIIGTKTDFFFYRLHLLLYGLDCSAVSLHSPNKTDLTQSCLVRHSANSQAGYCTGGSYKYFSIEKKSSPLKSFRLFHARLRSMKFIAAGICLPPTIRAEWKVATSRLGLCDSLPRAGECIRKVEFQGIQRPGQIFLCRICMLHFTWPTGENEDW